MRPESQPFVGAPRDHSMMAAAAPVEVETLPDARAVARGFDTDYPQLYARGYRVAFRLLGRRDDAADIAQEACARAYARWRSVGRYESAEAWVAHVAANLAIDAWRRNKTVDRHIDLTVPEPVRFDDERLDLHRALAELPRRQRQVVLLRFVADLPEAQVASVLGCSVGSVKTHASRGLASLRVVLGGKDA
jgi:RNA polymerase sigma-70 factor (sigma-E family)